MKRYALMSPERAREILDACAVPYAIEYRMLVIDQLEALKREMVRARYWRTGRAALYDGEATPLEYWHRYLTHRARANVARHPKGA